jgi:hypothetical protein
MTLLLRLGFLGFLLVAVSLTAASAAPPTLSSLMPTGAQRGQTTIVSANGEFSTWPVQAWCDRSDVTIAAETEKGKLRVSVADTATSGVAWVRIYNEEGASGPKPLILGTLPEVVEVEPNDAPAQAQAMNGSVVVSGKLAKSGDHDAFAMELKAGQTLVASLMAHETLGSPMDAVLQICELRDRRGKPEAFVLAQNHDAIGLDPQLAFTAPRNGRYLVRVFAYPSEPDAGVNFHGGENYVYRLTLTTGPFLDFCLPLAMQRGVNTPLAPQGVNLANRVVATTAPHDPLLARTAVSLPDAAGFSVAALVDLPCLVALSGTGREHAMVVQTPITVSGVIRERDKADGFKFAAKASQKLRLACESRSLGFPLTAQLQIWSSDGKRLATAEPPEPRKDVQLDFTPPADGEYVATVGDLHRQGGARCAYRLTIAESRPDFQLALAAAGVVVTPEKPAEIAITVTTSDSAGGIELSAIDLPAGFTLESLTTAQPTKSGEVVKLTLKVASDATLPASFPLRIVGKLGDKAHLAEVAKGPATLWATAHK